MGTGARAECRAVLIAALIVKQPAGHLACAGWSSVVVLYYGRSRWLRRRADPRPRLERVNPSAEAAQVD